MTKHLDLARHGHGPQSCEPALRQRGHGRVALPAEEASAELRACGARGAAAGIQITHQLARVGEIGHELAQELERLRRIIHEKLEQGGYVAQMDRRVYLGKQFVRTVAIEPEKVPEALDIDAFASSLERSCDSAA